MYTQKVVL